MKLDYWKTLLVLTTLYIITLCIRLAPALRMTVGRLLPSNTHSPGYNNIATGILMATLVILLAACGDNPNRRH